MSYAIIAILTAAALIQGSPVDPPPDVEDGPDRETTPAEEPGDPDPADAQAEDTAPSLDELLGLDEADDGAAEQAARQNEQELERRLRDAQISDVFVLALEKMQLSADLLDVELDPGLGTQRVQQDVLAKLDQLIDMAKEMSQQQQMSGGASSGQQGRPGQSQPQPGASKTAGASGQRQAGPAQDGSAIEPPPGRSGDINTVLEETESEWGHLPARLRDMLQQGRSGYISGLYRKLTEEYYKRLAEEGSS